MDIAMASQRYRTRLQSICIGIWSAVPPAVCRFCSTELQPLSRVGKERVLLDSNTLLTSSASQNRARREQQIDANGK